MTVTDQLKKILTSVNSTHGYIFVGQDRQSIKYLLTKLLKELEGTEENSSPLIDTKFFEGEGNGSLGIDTARRAKEFLYQMPIKSSQKTAIIVGGDALTQEAQNALLKISEDPPPNSQIIIILKNEENLLPTLRSRFSKMYLAEGEISKNDQHQIPEEVIHLADQFSKGDAHERAEVIKLVTGKVNDAGENKEDKTMLFLDALIFKLHKDPVKNASLLGAILERKTLIATHSLNKRLQLAFLSCLWYNEQ